MGTLSNEKPLETSQEAVQMESEYVKKEEEEEHRFDAQVDSLLSILINSVYSSKDYFLRELISNASDAIDKRKRKSYEQGCTVEEEMTIKIIPNKEKGILTIIDSGIGMSKAEMIKYLGSIATSGTKEFKKKLAEAKEKDMGALIGQFGLGFYSAFLVAEQVDVISKSQEDGVHIWSSRGPGGFHVAPYHAEAPQGTTVVLHISEKAKEYLEDKKIEDLVKVHSAFIEYPIYLHVKTEKRRKKAKITEDQPEKEEDKKEDEDKLDEDKVEEVKEEEEETYIEEEDKHLNSQKPLWTRNPRENPISEEEYEAFYKTLTNDWEKHFAVNHSHIEGDIEMQVLLFIPSRTPFNLFERSPKMENIKLYVQNVLITSDLTEAVPIWMKFISGVIGSKDLPVNISREITQGKSVMNLIRRVLQKKAIEMIKDLSADKEKYQKFYDNFSTSLKAGIYQEPSDIAKKLAELLRYKTSKSNGEYISLDQYIERMQPGQKQIYVITGTRLADIQNSPVLSAFEKYEVIFMHDPIDEIAIQNFRSYKDHPFQRITSEGVELPEQETVSEEEKKEFEDFLKETKEVLKTSIDKVDIKNACKLRPCTVLSGKYSYSSTMESIMRSQPNDDSQSMGLSSFMTKKNLEINTAHPIIKSLKAKLDAGNKEGFAKGIQLIFETALLDAGYPLPDTSSFTSKVFGYIEESINEV